MLIVINAFVVLAMMEMELIALKLKLVVPKKIFVMFMLIVCTTQQSEEVSVFVMKAMKVLEEFVILFPSANLQLIVDIIQSVTKAFVIVIEDMNVTPLTCKLHNILFR